MPTASLPVDIWLIIFDHIDALYNVLDDIDADSLTVLWCTVRNVSPYLRDCIDECFRYRILQSTFVNLSYSNMNYHGGPAFAHLHVPMAFSRLSSDGTRAVFRQMSYTKASSAYTQTGSVRGWLPFVERYYAETRKPAVQVLHNGEANIITGPPAWAQEHLSLRNTLAAEDKTNYLASLRDHTSIGRGYRPPYYLKIREAVNDTELVNLAIDCDAREISFDWRRTFAAFFTEQRFLMLSERSLGKHRTHDPDLVSAASRAQPSMHMHDYWNSNTRRARRKRLQPWVNENKHRMTPEDRLKAEDRVERTKHQVRRNLRSDNLRELTPADLTQALEEVVPEKCAEDLPYLMQWPWGHVDMYVAPRQPVQLRCGPKGCCVM
ncbi:hypothetical protein EKO04_004760 [Ascochyta lentis]|uniref:Uncharacterized protein n=1 Tax=Ascochyta lentis TaxID=205686 RepID=A0A8H7MJ37_9PLEO|nr:hypothetical protein EKO04_004760 [Ascochyta lentis]